MDEVIIFIVFTILCLDNELHYHTKLCFTMIAAIDAMDELYIIGMQAIPIHQVFKITFELIRRILPPEGNALSFLLHLLLVIALATLVIWLVVHKEVGEDLYMTFPQISPSCFVRANLLNTHEHLQALHYFPPMR